MKRRTRVAPAVVIGVAASALWGAGWATADEDLSMEEIVAILSAQQLGEVYEVERELEGYEVKIRDPEGAWLELYVDAKSGEILHEERVEPEADQGAGDGPDEEPDDGSDEEADEEPDEGSYEEKNDD